MNFICICLDPVFQRDDEGQLNWYLIIHLV